MKIMLTITPIQNNKFDRISLNSQPRPVFNQKSDTFERNNISFKGVDLHLPVREIEELFEQTYQALLKEPDNVKKYHLTRNCMKSLKELNNNADYKSLQIDRNHEIANQMLELEGHIVKLADSKVLYDCDLFRRSADNVIAVIRRYELFLDKGLDNNTMHPKEVFRLAREYASEYAQGKNVNLVVEGEDVLSQHGSGIFSPKKRLQDYSLYTVLTNLMQNAAKYSPSGSTVKVKSAEQVIDGKKYLTIAVKDAGIGIGDEDWKKALDGERAENAKAFTSGTGYGLKRIRRIIEFLQGKDDKILEKKSPLNPENTQYPGTEITAYLRLKD